MNSSYGDIAAVGGKIRVRDTKVQLAQLKPIFGWRLWITILCLCSGLLLSSLETTIIATALVSIASDLGDYGKSNWVVTSYLVTYTGFLIVFARTSDLFGRKGTLCAALAIFTVFSTACGVAQTMEQLIIFRAFQGIGGAGLYSMAMSVIAEITPLKYIGVASGLMGSIFALSSLLGPILGGIITSKTTWRWVFYLNIGPGAAALILILIVFPSNVDPLRIAPRTFACIDYPGTTLSLAGCIMLIFALEQGGLTYPWDSSVIIGTFMAGGLCLVGFAVWEWVITSSTLRLPILPLFPSYFVSQRILGSAILTAFLTGFPFMVTIVFLPQRFQIQNGMSPVDSGIRMLALLLLSATGAGLGGAISSKKNISWYILFCSLSLQLVGLGLMSTLPTDGEVQPAQYAYQVILGLGFGLSLSSIVIVVRMEVEAKDVSIIIAAVTQVRVLGGLIGIAIAQAVLTSSLLSNLSEILSPDDLSALLSDVATIDTFTADEKASTIKVYGEAFNLQNKIMLGFSAAGLLACMGAWKRRPEEFEEIESRRVQNDRKVAEEKEKERGGERENENEKKRERMGSAEGGVVVVGSGSSSEI